MCVTIYICCKYCVTSIFLTTVKSYDELLRKIKNISLCLQNRVTKKSKQILNAKIAVRTLCARRERAVNTLQQLFAHCENVRDAVKTLWERRVDAVRTLCTRYNWQVWYFRRILRHRRLVWLGLKQQRVRIHSTDGTWNAFNDYFEWQKLLYNDTYFLFKTW